MRAAPVLAQLHHLADVLLRREDRRADVGLADLLDERAVGHVGRRVHLDNVAIGQRQLVLDVRRGGEQLEVVFPLEPLTNDVHVQQAEEAAPEAEAERL